ncbi:hypothetical protein EVB32_080 [Rhizobium phage RHph_TM39]|uniref:Uncharacterized protein n=2 Tax=Cuauhnahuacvirus TaxID=3044696 RepID=A0A7S5UXM2_9CAUD|nr:hypothetical protein PQC16_gp080 [Rhizobium phage RHph_TM30]YP_010671227.1 hypothetical protein PQC17_gp078 [Rhizobium phage RHph_Y65]QIG71551.1 hypothetical protein EVB94_080 [Rhizobium phage RHph_TM40]QIG71914.1 hypothetical protein EVB95_080 [Rhizobium phage RHph_TM2_3B]QIG72276.1 hypothetical protein EVB96_080 [Rhizobium phage RHph_TM3_3_6]QIG77068.1 hypothetical protein EVB32_080 [Rhizobium phage RHph_TM39]QIG77407.1 hypothetical protein EVB61_079 [Rhizobium phage RHph_TM21B]QIG77667
MTKRQWRRYRGKIIANGNGLENLRNVRFSSMVMTDLTNVFHFKTESKWHLDFWYQ